MNLPLLVVVAAGFAFCMRQLAAHSLKVPRLPQIRRRLHSAGSLDLSLLRLPERFLWPLACGPCQLDLYRQQVQTASVEYEKKRGGARGDWRHIEPGICSLQTGSEHASSGSQLLSQDNDDDVDEDNDRLQRQDSAGAGAPLVRLGISALRLQRKDININEPL